MATYDKELRKVIDFIRNELLPLKGGEGGGLRAFAKKVGLKEYHLTRLKNWDNLNKNNAFWIVYRVLWGLLEHEPINYRPLIPRIVLAGEADRLPPKIHVEDYYAVPMVEGRIAAGAGRIPGEAIEDLVWVYKPEIRSRRALVAVKLAKDAVSMQPTLRPGDIVIIDRGDKAFDAKGLFAVRTSQEACAVKRLQVAQGRIWLISDNPDFPQEPSEFENLHDLVIGRVVWSWTSWVR